MTSPFNMTRYGFDCRKFIGMAAGAMLAALPATSFAKSPTQTKQVEAQNLDLASLDIRGHETSSIDLFDVLSRMPKAKQAYNEGRFSQALQHYRYVYLHDHRQAQALLGYADCALALGQVKLAASLYMQVQDHNEARVQAGILMSRVLGQEIAQPEPALRAQITRTPNDARLRNLLGRVLDDKSKGALARKAYSQAGRLEQRAGLMHNNIGQSFLREGQHKAALEAFTRAVLLAPNTQRFDNNRRLVLLLEKDYSAALAQIDSERASGLLKDAAIITERQGEIRLAEFFMEKAIKLDPVYNPKSAAYWAQLKARRQVTDLNQ